MAEHKAFPREVAKPAQRALATVGVTQMQQLSGFTEAEIAALHGMGPKALGALKAALHAQGLDFKASK